MVSCWAYSQLVPALSRLCCCNISNYSDVLVSILCLLILIAKLSPNKKCMAILMDVFLSQYTIDCTHISTQKRWHSPCISADLIPSKTCCLFEVKCIFLLWHMFNIYIYTITKTKVPQKHRLRCLTTTYSYCLEWNAIALWKVVLYYSWHHLKIQSIIYLSTLNRYDFLYKPSVKHTCLTM